MVENASMYRRTTEKMIMVEGKVPPPFGLITPDALSPSLFTLLQQLGHEGVNKASSPSTAWIKTSARKLRSLSGPCQTILWRYNTAADQLGLGSFFIKEAHKATWGKKKQLKKKKKGSCCKRALYRSGLTALQQANWGAIKAKVIRLTWSEGGEGGEKAAYCPLRAPFILLFALVFSSSFITQKNPQSR